MFKLFTTSSSLNSKSAYMFIYKDVRILYVQSVNKNSIKSPQKSFACICTSATSTPPASYINTQPSTLTHTKRAANKSFRTQNMTLLMMPIRQTEILENIKIKFEKWYPDIYWENEVVRKGKENERIAVLIFFFAGFVHTNVYNLCTYIEICYSVWWINF